MQIKKTNWLKYVYISVYISIFSRMGIITTAQLSEDKDLSVNLTQGPVIITSLRAKFS